MSGKNGAIFGHYGHLVIKVIFYFLPSFLPFQNRNPPSMTI